jgi:transposase-like protein
VVDGLKGFPGAITSVFPKTVVQTSIVGCVGQVVEKGHQGICDELSSCSVNLLLRCLRL